MRKVLSFFILASSIASCKKDFVSVAPKADFTINDNSSPNFITATYDAFDLNNTSTDADSYTWDLGNGITSSDKELAIWYPKSGTYTITLTAINKDGKKSAISKTVVVKDRVLKQIVIPSLNFKSALGFFNSNYPSGKANIWVEIQQAEPGRWDYTLLNNGTYNVPVVYKSPIVSNVDPNSTPVTFDVTQKFIIDYPTLVGTSPPGKGYAFNLFAQDATGTYLLTSNYGSGVGYSAVGDVSKNKFAITTGFEGSNITLNCDFE